MLPRPDGAMLLGRVQFGAAAVAAAPALLAAGTPDVSWPKNIPALNGKPASAEKAIRLRNGPEERKEKKSAIYLFIFASRKAQEAFFFWKLLIFFFFWSSAER